MRVSCFFIVEVKNDIDFDFFMFKDILFKPAVPPQLGSKNIFFRICLHLIPTHLKVRLP